MGGGGRGRGSKFKDARVSGGKEGRLAGRTFLDLGFLHLVVDGLLQLALVAVGESVDVDLRLALVHRRAFLVVNPVGDVLRPVRGLVAVAMTGRDRCRLLGDIGNWLGGRLLKYVQGHPRLPL